LKFSVGYVVVAQQCRLRNKKDFETELLLSQGFNFKSYKMHITAILTHLVAKLCKNKNLERSFKVTADAAIKGKIYGICSMADLSKRNFAMVLK